jgi:hypothetical protein
MQYLSSVEVGESRSYVLQDFQTCAGVEPDIGRLLLAPLCVYVCVCVAAAKLHATLTCRLHEYIAAAHLNEYIAAAYLPCHAACMSRLQEA